jgi:LDH2 family malate/lactate/ureidoglycolate dehydrogenase
MGKRLLPGWAVDAEGAPTDDPAAAAPGGALLPLGGFGTATGGHKGYGLGALCEILCGVLSGGAFGPRLTTGGITAGDGLAGHFFGALRIDAIRDAAAFKADMDRELRAFRSAAPAEGAERVLVAGDPEREHEQAFRSDGVPHLPAVWTVLDELAGELGITPLQRC